MSRNGNKKLIGFQINRRANEIGGIWGMKAGDKVMPRYCLLKMGTKRHTKSRCLNCNPI